jgi:hypothetical protein
LGLAAAALWAADVGRANGREGRSQDHADRWNRGGDQDIDVRLSDGMLSISGEAEGKKVAVQSAQTRVSYGRSGDGLTGRTERFVLPLFVVGDLSLGMERRE